MHKPLAVAELGKGCWTMDQLPIATSLESGLVVAPYQTGLLTPYIYPCGRKVSLLRFASAWADGGNRETIANFMKRLAVRDVLRRERPGSAPNRKMPGQSPY